MAEMDPTGVSPEPGATMRNAKLLGKIGSLTVFECSKGLLTDVNGFDSIVIPVDIWGRHSGFMRTLSKVTPLLAERGAKALGEAIDPDGIVSLSPERPAILVSAEPRPALIAACGSTMPNQIEAARRATLAALEITSEFGYQNLLLPVLGVGSSKIPDPSNVGQGLAQAIIAFSRASDSQANIFILTQVAKALEAIRRSLRAFTESREPPPELSKRRKASAKSVKPPPQEATSRSIASAEPTPTLRTSTAPGFRPDSQGDNARDMVGVGAEIQAFAKLAAFRDIPPPLAVGVFGDWGSGKSFFMAGVRRKIDEFAAAARAEIKAATDKGEPAPITDFHANVVQIEFNAWHYIESNLWASLVEYIFSRLEEWLRRENDPKADEVGALFDSLATSRQLKLETARQVMNANAELHDAQKAVADAEAERAEKAASKAVAARAFRDDAMKAAFSDATMKPIRDALAKAGLGTATAGYDQLAELGGQLKETGGRSRLLWQSAQGLVAKPMGWAAIASLVIIPLAVPPLAQWVLNQVGMAHVQLSDLLTGATAVAATAAGWIKGFLGVANPALDRAEEIHTQIKAKKAALEKQALAAEDTKLAEVQNALKEADKALSAAQERFNLASVQAAEAQNRYYSESARGRLNRFIRERLADGTYGKHLGLIATIRKDFDQLTNLVEGESQSADEQKRYHEEKQAYELKVEALIAEADRDGRALLAEADKTALVQAQDAKLPTQPFKRIILYIDDLDRCPPEKVVEVIQAVHMLLCFRLFVVFVAVDARWVTQALQVVFEKQLAVPGATRDATDPLAASSASNRATANDYMEKIFQIPYWVRPLQGKVAGGFMTKMVEEFGINRPEDNVDAGVTLPPVSTAPTADANAAEVKAIQSDAVTDPIARNGGPDSPSDDETLAAGNPGASIAKLEKLKLVEADLVALAALAPTVGDSPRRVKRFFNTYLLIQTIALVTVNGEASDIDPDAKKDFDVLLTGCTFEQQTVALATCLALAMQGEGLTLSAAHLAGLQEREVAECPAKFQPALRAYLSIRKDDPEKPDGLASVFQLFMPIAQRYGFSDLGETRQ